MKTLVIIPAYNEEKHIGSIVRAALGILPFAVLVVNDGSGDDTACEAGRAGAIVITHNENLGYGKALKTGYRFAMKFDFDAILQLDADGQHDPAYLPAFLTALADADVVIGSRFLEGPTYPIPFFRRQGMRLFNFITSRMGTAITDTTSGYRAYSARAVRECLRIPWEYPDANLLIALHRRGMKIAEIPIRMHANREGKSMHSGIEPVRYVANVFLSLLKERAG